MQQTHSLLHLQGRDIRYPCGLAVMDWRPNEQVAVVHAGFGKLRTCEAVADSAAARASAAAFSAVSAAASAVFSLRMVSLWSMTSRCRRVSASRACM